MKFPKVKTLLNVMNAVTDVNIKKEIREKIITGTLHVIYAFIKSNEFFLVPNVNYDIEKIITDNLYCEQILERMKNGKQFPINNFERFSAIFNFRFQENMTFEEIAQELGISQKNVRSIYELALERARYFVKVLK